MAEFGTPETWNMKVGDFIESELPKEKPQALLDLQEQNRKQRLLDSLQKIGPGLMDESLDFIKRENFKRGNIANHPVKPLTKDQQKIYDMMLNKELPTNRPSVADRLVKRFNKPWEELDNTARANFINQTYPRYKKLLERSGNRVTRNQLAEILSEKLDRPISLGQIHGYGSNRSGQRQKTAFGKKLDEILDVKRVTPKNPMYKIPTDADIKKLEPLLDITPSNSLKNSTVDNVVKLNKKYAGMYKSGQLPSLEQVIKDFPDMTATQASNATIRLSQIYSGNKFKLFSNLDPKLKKAVENIKVDKKLGDKVFKLIGDSKFNDYRNAMYRISLGMIDEKLGNKKGTFEALKLKARNILKENKIPVYSPEKKNAAGKVIQKAKKGFNINEIAGVSGSAKSKAAEFSQFIDVMEGNLNQKTMTNFQSKLSSAREIIEKNPEMLFQKSKEINRLAKNLEDSYDVKLPRLRGPEAEKYFSPKRLKELQAQGLDIVKAAERAGYTIQMPRGSQTIQEFVKKPKIKQIKPGMQPDGRLVDLPGGQSKGFLGGEEAAKAAGRSLLTALKVLGQPSIAAGIAADELRQGNIKTGGAALLAPELVGSFAPAGRGILSTIGRIAANPFGKAARAFTPVGAATIGAGALYDVYKEYERRQALTDEERLEEDLERDEAADEMMVGAAEGGRIGFADGPKDPSKRKFMKLMGIMSLLPFGIGKGFKMAEKAAPVVAEGAKLGFDNFIKLVAKIKTLGKKDPGRTTMDRQEATIYTGKDGSEYELIEDMTTGDIRITKDKPGVQVYGRGTEDVEGIDVIQDRSQFEFKVGQADETTKGKKPPDEYEEGKLEAFDGETFDAVDDVDDQTVKEILDEID